MLREADIAYIAGLFDGEGSVTYKKYYETKKKRDGSPRKTYTWRIVMEVTMTDESVLRWMMEILGCGTLNKKPRDKTGHKMQYRWRCCFRDAYYVARLLWPYAHTKLPKITKIIEHYAKERLDEGAQIINLTEFRNANMERKTKV